MELSKDEIISLAREAGLMQSVWPSDFPKEYTDGLERFADLVAAHEREACAKVCDEIARRYQRVGTMVADGCAAAIRARGN